MTYPDMHMLVLLSLDAHVAPDDIDIDSKGICSAKGHGAPGMLLCCSIILSQALHSEDAFQSKPLHVFADCIPS